MPHQRRHPDAPFGVYHRVAVVFDGSEFCEADHDPSDALVTHENICAAQGENWDLGHSRLPDESAEIRLLSRGDEHIGRPSDSERGVLP